MQIIMRGLLALLIASMAITAQAEILVQDDFNDNSLDATKWWIDIQDHENRTGAEVEEVNQQIELAGRGYLNTLQQFDPLDYDTIQITGTWQFVSSDDMLQILTRSDADPTKHAYGETNAGIEFRYVAHDHSFNIYGRNVGVANLVTNNNLDFAAGDTFSFLVQDDGENLYFEMREVGDANSWATASGTSTSDSALDYIVFHNRENPAQGTRRSNLDNITIANVPEPGPVVLLGVGLLAALAWSYRRRSGDSAAV